MARKGNFIFPQDGDRDSGLNFSLWSARSMITNYVETGMHFTVDWVNDTVDISEGRAYILYDSEDKVVMNTTRTGIALPEPAGPNYVFLTPDFGVNDQVGFTINTTNTDPAGPSLKIGEINTATETIDEQNRAPNFDLTTINVDHLYVHQDAWFVDDTPACFGPNKEFCIRYDMSVNEFRIDNNGTVMLAIEDNGGDLRIPNSATIGTLDVTDLSTDSGLFRSKVELNDGVPMYLGTDNDFQVRYDAGTDNLQIIDSLNNVVLDIEDNGGGVTFNTDVSMGKLSLSDMMSIVGGSPIEFGGKYQVEYNPGSGDFEISDTTNGLVLSTDGTSITFHKSANLNGGGSTTTFDVSNELSMSTSAPIYFGSSNQYRLLYTSGRLRLYNGGNTIMTFDPTITFHENIDFGYYQAEKFRLDNRTSDPSNVPNGTIWYRSDLD